MVRFALLLVLALAGAFLFVVFATSSPIKIETQLKKNLAVVSPGGICGPGGCGLPEGERETIRLELSGEQVTAVLNAAKPGSVLLSDMKVAFYPDHFDGEATSFYPVLPGKLSGSGRFNLGFFKVDKVYIGGIEAPEKVANFVEANGNGLWEDWQKKYGIRVDKLELTGDKVYVEANVPVGLVRVEEDGAVRINLP